MKEEEINQNGTGAANPESSYHLEDEQSIRNYHRVLEYQEQHPDEKKTLSYLPMISVVVPVYNTATKQLKAAVDSVLSQDYPHYELILVDDHSSWENVKPVLQAYEKREKVRIIYRSENGNISEATNEGLKIAKGEFIAFMDCDDVITPDALYEVACKLNENPELDFIYSDEDKITEDGRILHMPFFKPDWSPDLAMTMMYTNHLGVFRASIVNETGGLRTAYNGSQDYDFLLRFMEHTDNSRVGHIPKVLYHWRERKESVGYSIGAKDYALIAAKNAKEDMLRRRGIRGRLEFIPDTQQYRVVYEPQSRELVSIIIPSRDHPDILQQCVRSLREFTDYPYYEIIVVDNGSSEENKARIGKLLEENHAKYIYGKYSFNFSKMCNLGASEAAGSFLLFLNDDIELFQPDWLSRMLGQAQQKHTGAVGAKLYYPGTTIIQHAGVADIHEGPSHNFLRLDDRNIYYFGLNRNDYNCIAVTGACLLVRREIYERVQGFDESFPVAYNDVDFCMKIHELGLYNVQRNDVTAYHHESLSRGNDHLNEEKMLRLSRERWRLYKKHPSLQRNDPFLNRNLHMYHSTLDPMIKYDLAEPAQKNTVRKARKRGVCHIDSIVRTDRVRIVGWSWLKGMTDEKDLQKYLILTDPYGNQIQARVHRMMRRDLVTALGREDVLWNGFECVLDPDIVRSDLLQFKIGILTRGRGKNYISWAEQLTELCPEPERQLLYSERMSVFDYSGNQRAKENLRSHLDLVQQRDDGLLISGWAFFEEEQHYLYRKEIVLVDESGKGYLFQTMPKSRFDVSAAFPGVHFLLDAGFQCLICDELLPSEHTYDLILRMTESLNPQNFYDYRMVQNISFFDRQEEKSGDRSGSEDRTAPETVEVPVNSEQQTMTALVQIAAEKDFQLNEMIVQVNRLQDEYDRITESTIWRMTGPARVVLDKAKTVRRKVRSRLKKAAAHGLTIINRRR